jgi:hypothetical protein
LALAVLKIYRLMQVEHIAHRNRLLKMLQHCLPAGAVFRPGHFQGDGQTNSIERPQTPTGRKRFWRSQGRAALSSASAVLEFEIFDNENG